MFRRIKFEQFPLVSIASEKGDWALMPGEITFSGKVRNCTVCFIDIIGSTKVSARMTPAALGKYYSLFLNSIAHIANNFRARIVKNAGDSLIFCFDEAGDPKDTHKFRNVLDCGLTMGLASNTLNARMATHNLPPIEYRISAEYGRVSVARSRSSASDDLFGPAMNICAKINSLARPNGLLIGNALHEIVAGMGEYVFGQADGLAGSESLYPAYHVEAREQADTINPFEVKALY